MGAYNDRTQKNSKPSQFNSSKPGVNSKINFESVKPTPAAPAGSHIRFSDSEETSEPIEEKKTTVKKATLKPDAQNLQRKTKTTTKVINTAVPKKKEANLSNTNLDESSSKLSKEEVNALFLKEVTSLGGSKKDFELLKNLDSDEEVVMDSEDEEVIKSDEPKKLTADLSKFIKQLGISKLKVEDLDDDQVPAEEQEVVAEVVDEKAPIAQPAEAPEPEIVFNPSDSIVTKNFSTRAFAHNGLFRPQAALFSPLTKPLFESTQVWHEIPVPQLSEGEGFSSEYAVSLKNQSKALWEQECDLVYKKASRSSDKGLMEQIMKSGTLSDKISALTLKIQEDPLHHINELNKLLGMMGRNNRREAMPCLNSFKDLCVGILLPSERKLIFFEDQPLSNPNVTQSHLVLWYFEDFIKRSFFDFLMAAEARSHDPVGTAKHNVLTYFYELLSSKPEQGANLLTLLANKLGDKDNKIASRSSHLLLKTTEMNPEMKIDIVQEVDSIISRPNISVRTQYYSSLTLNQFMLTKSEVTVANQLIEIYFRLFKKFLNLSNPKTNPEEKKKKLRHRDTGKPGPKVPVEPTPPSNEEEISRAITAILSGVNRAFPYAEIEPEVLAEHVNTLFHISRTFNFNAAIQALTLLLQISTSKPEIRPRLRKALYQGLLDPRIIHSSKQSMHLNLLHRFLKDEADLSTIVAFVKRMCQIASWHQPPYANGLLYIVSKLSETQLIINSAIDQPEDSVSTVSSNSNLELNNTATSNKSTSDKDSEVTSIQPNPESTKTEVINSMSYDGRSDAPSKSYAEYTCLWELEFLLRHFHPTVSHFGRQILTKDIIQEQPELHNHTLIHFLDRFAYRNAKKTNDALSDETVGVQATFAPNQATSGLKWVKNSVSQNDRMDINFINKKSDQVAADQIFFHKYFNLQKDATKKKVEIPQEPVSDGEEEFFTSLFGGPEEQAMDEDLDEEMMDFSASEEGGEDQDDDDDDEEDVADEDQNLTFGEDAPGFDDFSGSEADDLDVQPSSDAEDSAGDSEEDALLPVSAGKESESDGSDDDIDFDFDSDDEPSVSRTKKGSASSKKRKLPSEPIDDEETKPKEPLTANQERNRATKERKKKLRALPTFASMDDYAGMLSD